jgi:TetR/AcrR family transcriptional regulator
MPAPLKASRRTTVPRRVRAAATARRAATAPEQDGRDRILTAAIRAFSEVGYAGATTAGIARAASVTQPLVHHHFRSKEGLWRAAVDHLFAHVPRITARADDGMEPRAALTALIERFVRFVAEHPEVTRIVAREGAAPSPRLDYLLKRHLHEPFREVVDLLRAAQHAGILSADVRPELCLFMVLGAGSHLFDVSALAERSQGIDTTAAWTREAFVAGLRTLLERGLFGGTNG